MMNFEMDTNNIVAMFRLKNEERWIEKTLRAVSDICSKIVILDDGSTDNTIKICKTFDKVIDIHQQQNLPFDEARDNNILWKMALRQNPDFILNLAGDEILQPNSRDILFEEINVLHTDASVFEFQFLYMWDKPNQYRYDGEFSDEWHKTLVRMKGQPENLVFHGTQCAGNGHCYRLPNDLIGWDKPVRSKIKILHYGNFDEKLRWKKYQFYNKLDPKSEVFDEYTHIISEKGKLSGPNGIELKHIPEGMFINDIQ